MLCVAHPILPPNQGWQSDRLTARAIAPTFTLMPGGALPAFDLAVPVSFAISSQDSFWREATIALLEQGVIVDDDCQGENGQSLRGIIEHCFSRFMQRAETNVLEARLLVIESPEQVWLGEHDYFDSTEHDPEEAALYLAVILDSPVERVLQPVMEQLARQSPELAETVMVVLREARWNVPHFWTPDLALDIASYQYWDGEDDESEAISMDGLEEGEVLGRKEFDSIPNWALTPSRKLEPEEILEVGLVNPAIKPVCDALLAVMDWLSLDADLFDFLCEGLLEGLMLRWNNQDVMQRVFDDRNADAYNHSDFYAETVGLRRIPLGNSLEQVQQFKRGCCLTSAVSKLIELISVVEERV